MQKKSQENTGKISHIIMLFLCLYYAAFPLKFKNGKRIRSWGDELEILRLILAEFSDKTNPPKKSVLKKSAKAAGNYWKKP